MSSTSVVNHLRTLYNRHTWTIHEDILNRDASPSMVHATKFTFYCCESKGPRPRTNQDVL